MSDLPGPDGRVSFREAVIAANNTPGPQTIAFAIPISEFWLLPDVALLKLEDGAFFVRDAGTTVDFSTQTANIGDTNPNGPEVGIYGLEANGWGTAAIFVNGNDCVIKGLGKVYQRGYAVEFVGDNNRLIGSQVTGPLHAAINIEGYSTTIPTGNIIGGTAPGEGNELSSVTIRGPADDNVVVGNIVIGGGVSVVAATRYGVSVHNNRIGGPTVAERNVISGAGGYGEEGYPVGEQVSVVDADGTIVEGNYIGTTVDGMARYPQQIGPIGVEVRDSRNTTIRGNLIAGMRTVGINHYNGQIFGWAVLVGATNASTYDTVLEGNTIGLAVDGVTPIVTRSGITVSPLSANYHAFDTLIENNHIARVETTGLTVGAQENGVIITRNSIHDSGALGIDLFRGNFGGVGGVTLNDPGDLDVGGNGLQNFPVLISATSTGSSVTIEGTLDSWPSEQYTVEFFASPSCDASGYGEGTRFLGSTTVVTDGSGHGVFSATGSAVAAGEKATATTRRHSTGDTSEFSACVAVALGSGRTAFDYDGDGKSDVSVFRPSTGLWYLLRSTAGYTGMHWGEGTDKITPADYDGDGKTDVAVFRASNSTWYIFNSATQTFSTENWGQAGDLAVPADYDGDGKAEVAVYRPSGAMWYRKLSGGGFSFVNFGTAEDKPVPADWDGDGKADIGVFRPSTGIWYLLRTTAGFTGIEWGVGTDIQAPGDYDGDGRTDVAVFRPSNGTWYLVMSTAGFASVAWGQSGDVPSAGDFDGDGKTDVAVFRPSNGHWYILNSTAGIADHHFGESGDQPTQSAFRY